MLDMDEQYIAEVKILPAALAGLTEAEDMAALKVSPQPTLLSVSSPSPFYRFKTIHLTFLRDTCMSVHHIQKQ